MNDAKIHTCIIVDDSEQDVFLTGRLFKSAKVDLLIRHYTSAEAVLEALCKEKEALVEGSIILIDRYLGFDNGIDLVRALRQQNVEQIPQHHLQEGVEKSAQENFLSETIIGICSGSHNVADKEDADCAGASFFIQKPLDIDALRRICEAVPSLEMTTTTEGLVSLLRK